MADPQAAVCLTRLMYGKALLAAVPACLELRAHVPDPVVSQTEKLCALPLHSLHQVSCNDALKPPVWLPCLQDKAQSDVEDADPVEEMRAHHTHEGGVNNPDDDVPGHGGKA